MRIVGGRNKGRSLKAPKGQATRPTSDRARESVFNILNARLEGGFEGLTVVDLFAGTGAYGLEALSRGAAQAVLVDNNREAIKIIEENVVTLGETNRAILQKRDATELGSLPHKASPADLVFLDPGSIHDPRSIRHHFIHIAAPGNGSGALGHTQYGVSLIGLDRLVGVYTDQEVVPQSASLFEKLYMPIVK